MHHQSQADTMKVSIIFVVEVLILVVAHAFCLLKVVEISLWMLATSITIEEWLLSVFFKISLFMMQCNVMYMC